MIRIADWLLGCAIDRASDAAIGDLHEEFLVRCHEHSRLRAVCWYWSQALRSMPWLLWAPIRRGGFVSTLRVALVACAVQAIVELLTAASLPRVLAPSFALAASLAIVVSSLFSIGFIATRIKSGAGTLFALVALAIVALDTLAVPLTFNASRLLGLLTAPLAAFAGTAVSIHRRRRLEVDR